MLGFFRFIYKYVSKVSIEKQGIHIYETKLEHEKQRSCLLVILIDEHCIRLAFTGTVRVNHTRCVHYSWKFKGKFFNSSHSFNWEKLAINWEKLSTCVHHYYNIPCWCTHACTLTCTQTHTHITGKRRLLGMKAARDTYQHFAFRQFFHLFTHCNISWRESSN